ncbi:MAG: hypothetical protein P4L50_17905 [Anaerolineaceae bacterium]|nr:hypothetical protein [Anaerolineaceae bacterium]
MTQRTILVGNISEVIVRAGADVVVTGFDGDQITAETNSHWGLKLERSKDEIKVQIGSSGQVLVPFNHNIKISAGKDLRVEGMRGDVTAVAGRHLVLKGIYRLVKASAGGRMDIDCDTLVENDLKLSAGSDMRLYIHDLNNTLLQINDMGGHWDTRIGTANRKIKLNAGGEVTLVTARQVEALPPDYILGRVEKPSNP